MNVSKSVIRAVFVLAIFLSNISFAQAEFTSETISIKDGLSHAMELEQLFRICTVTFGSLLMTE